MKSVPTPPSSIRLQSFFRNDTRISYLLTHINFQRIKLQHRKSNKIIRCTCCKYTERSVNTWTQFEIAEWNEMIVFFCNCILARIIFKLYPADNTAPSYSHSLRAKKWLLFYKGNTKPLISRLMPMIIKQLLLVTPFPQSKKEGNIGAIFHSFHIAY